MSSAKRQREAINWTRVGERVRQLRGDLTQADFAGILGVSQGHLSYIERGQKEIGAEILLTLHRICGESIEWILTGRD